MESAINAGSRFVVSLPREAEPATELCLVPAATLTQYTEVEEGARVLVADDEPQVRRMIRTALAREFGCDVDSASNGIEALEGLSVNAYDLVISDVKMATMDGTELYLWLREARPAMARRFLSITGFPGDARGQNDIAHEKAQVITKPFSVEQLCRACAPFLTGARELAHA